MISAGSWGERRQLERRRRDEKERVHRTKLIGLQDRADLVSLIEFPRRHRE